MRISCDRSRTAERFAELERYMTANVLDGSEFVCPHYDDCLESQSGDFYEGQLHHVGPSYDLSVAGRPYRVMVVGQEYGREPPLVSLASRRAHFIHSGYNKRFKAEPGRPARSPHMRGTTSALRILHGLEPGADHDGEFIEVEGLGRTHLFETYSLANYLLCSAVAPNTMRGRSTRTMKAACGDHFKAAVEILSPTVIVIQGKGFAKWVTSQLPSYEEIGDGLARSELPEGPAIIVPLAHPSAAAPHSWSSLEHECLDKTVRPALREARRLTLERVSGRMSSRTKEGPHVGRGSSG